MNISEASNIYVGSTGASAVYLGADLVWPTVVPYEENIDGQSFRIVNNISSTSQWSTNSGTYNLRSDGSAQITVGPDTTEIGSQHDHLYITARDSQTYPDWYMFWDDTRAEFTGANYQVIKFKNIDSDSKRGLTGFTCNTGTITWDAAEDAYIWRGNSNDVVIYMNGVCKLGFQYFEIQCDLFNYATDNAKVRTINSWVGDVTLSNDTMYYLGNYNFLITSKGYSNTPTCNSDYLLVRNNLNSLGNRIDNGYIIINAPGYMKRVKLVTYNNNGGNRSLPTVIPMVEDPSQDAGTVVKNPNGNTYIEWTGYANPIMFKVEDTNGNSLYISRYEIDYYLEGGH